MESIPLSVLDGVGVVGLVVLFFIGLMRGWIVTSREVGLHIERAEKAEERVAELTKENASLMSFAELGKATFTALSNAADAGDPR